MRHSIPNWTSDAEARELGRLAAGKMVLEVGTYRGFGAVLMAQAGARVWAVDWHRGDSGGDPGLGAQDTLCAWWQNVRRYQLEDRIVGLVGRSMDVLPMLRGEAFDLAFIDADHGYPSVRCDIGYTLPLVRRGGVIACHDYSPVWPGVVRAVDELQSRHGRPGMAVIDSLAVVRLR